MTKSQANPTDKAAGAALPIVMHPHQVLTQRAAPVATVDDAVRATLKQMLDTMYTAANGVGLAANQVNILQRLVVMDLGVLKKNGERDYNVKAPICMVNPKIVWQSEDTVRRMEGCLSFPELFAEVTRPARVVVQYTDETGKDVEQEGGELFAVCAQHEIDHLDGILFPQRMSKLRRDMALRKWEKLRAIWMEQGGVDFVTLTHDRGVLPALQAL